MKTLQLLFFFALAFNVTQTFSQDDFLDEISSPKPIKIGDKFEINVSTEHPYKSLAAGVAFEREFHSKNASYVKLYFEDFNLAPGDYVEVYSPKTDEQFIYAGKGILLDEYGTTINTFWSNAIFADKVIVKLHTVQASQGFGFNITKVAYGFSQEKIAQINSNLKTIGRNDREEIACYEDTEMFEKGKAVAKLIIRGESLCTGWLLGCEGNLMTNNHCIGSASDARDIEYIFNYRTEDCQGNRKSPTESVNGSTFIKTNSTLDYTLVKLPKQMHEKYGYLSLSSKAPQTGDRIYIPQHPKGELKKIAVKSDQDTGGFAKLRSAESNMVTYFADTEGGSSGSPVINYDSNLVIAIHNKGTTTYNLSDGPSPGLIRNIGRDMPKCGIDDNSGGSKPIPNFIASINCNTVSFMNLSANSKNYKWDFGDGNSSTEKEPTHTYTKDGKYTVKLTASQDNDSADKTLEINITSSSIMTPKNQIIGVCKDEPAKIELNATDGDYIWYDSATNGKIIGTGASYDAGTLNSSKTFYVSATGDKVTKGNVGLKTINQSQGGINNGGLSLVFNAKQNFILNSIKVYAESSGKRTLQLKNANGATIKTLDVNIPSGESRIDVNLRISKGENLQLAFNEECGLFRTNSTNIGYPFTLAGGAVTIIESTASKPKEYYYYAYDWDITVIGDCETERGKIEVQPATKPSKPAVSVNKKDGTATLKTKDTYKFYQWYFNDKAIEGATKQSYSTKKEGSYYVEVSNVKGCDAVSDKIVVDNLSNNEFTLPKGVAMYPNPTKGILNLTGLDKIGKNNSFKLINMLGQHVKTLESNKINEKLDVSGLSKGMYFLSINNTYMVKFVKN